MKIWLLNRLFKRWHFFVAMYALWMLFNYQWDLFTWLSGAMISLMMTLFTSSVLYDQTHYKTHMISPLKMLTYVLNLLKEIFLAFIGYVALIFKGHYEIVVFEMQLAFEDPLKTALVANSITLTPGTVSIDVNGSTLTVMALVKKGTSTKLIQASIRRQFERRLQGSTK